MEKPIGYKPYLQSLFWVTLILYVILLLLDAAHSGFVSYFFSEHWLLLILLGTGGWLWSIGDRFILGRRTTFVLLLVLSLLALMIGWNLGESVGSARVLVALLSALVPWCAYLLIRS